MAACFLALAVQGCGLTECAPMITLNPDKPELMRNESIGHVMPTLQARIDNPNEDGIGEICLSGGNIMMGYYNNPEATAAVRVVSRKVSTVPPIIFTYCSREMPWLLM